jgi:cold shock CspA family protein
MEIHYGTLTRYFPDKNYFFIRDDDMGVDVFVHVSGFTAKLAPPKGTRVRYHIVSNPRRPGNTMAVDVQPMA